MQSLLATFLGDAPHNQGGNRATNAPFVGAVRPLSPFLSVVSLPRLADGWVRVVSVLGTGYRVHATVRLPAWRQFLISS